MRGDIDIDEGTEVAATLLLAPVAAPEYDVAT